MVYEVQWLYYQAEMISWLHKAPMFAACSWHLRILQLATSESETGGAGEARPGGQLGHVTGSARMWLGVSSLSPAL